MNKVCDPKVHSYTKPKDFWMDVWMVTYYWINVENEIDECTVYVTLKSLLSPLHEILGFQMDDWTEDLNMLQGVMREQFMWS